MPLDEELFARAQARDRVAVEGLLESFYTLVHRISQGLSGREDVARGIIRFMMSQAVKRLPQWRDADAAERWFLHHTVLTSRRAARHQPGDQDVLLRLAEAQDPPYLAFVRALRTLPQQQQEAFILHHGEHLNSRFLGIAMDCSTKAADMHLQTAQGALADIAGGDYPALRDRMAQAYAKLAPAEDRILPSIRGYVRQSIWPRRIRRLAIAAIALALVAAAAWLARRLTAGG